MTRNPGLSASLIAGLFFLESKPIHADTISASIEEVHSALLDMGYEWSELEGCRLVFSRSNGRESNNERWGGYERIWNLNTILFDLDTRAQIVIAGENRVYAIEFELAASYQLLIDDLASFRGGMRFQYPETPWPPPAPGNIDEHTWEIQELFYWQFPDYRSMNYWIRHVADRAIVTPDTILRITYSEAAPLDMLNNALHEYSLISECGTERDSEE